MLPKRPARASPTALIVAEGIHEVQARRFVLVSAECARMPPTLSYRDRSTHAPSSPLAATRSSRRCARGSFSLALPRPCSLLRVRTDLGERGVRSCPRGCRRCARPSPPVLTPPSRAGACRWARSRYAAPASRRAPLTPPPPRLTRPPPRPQMMPEGLVLVPMPRTLPSQPPRTLPPSHLETTACTQPLSSLFSQEDLAEYRAALTTRPASAAAIPAILMPPSPDSGLYDSILPLVKTRPKRAFNPGPPRHPRNLTVRSTACRGRVADQGCAKAGVLALRAAPPRLSL